eukprot:1143614-Amphidinium_carterae.1
MLSVINLASAYPDLHAIIRMLYNTQDISFSPRDKAVNKALLCESHTMQCAMPDANLAAAGK